MVAKCPICAVGFDNEPALRHHVWEYHRCWKCPLCPDYITDDRHNFRRHLLGSRRHPLSQLLCAACEAPFTNGWDYYRHIRDTPAHDYALNVGRAYDDVTEARVDPNEAREQELRSLIKEARRWELEQCYPYEGYDDEDDDDEDDGGPGGEGEEKGRRYRIDDDDGDGDDEEGDDDDDEDMPGPSHRVPKSKRRRIGDAAASGLTMVRVEKNVADDGDDDDDTIARLDSIAEKRKRLANVSQLGDIHTYPEAESSYKLVLHRYEASSWTGAGEVQKVVLDVRFTNPDEPLPTARFDDAIQRLFENCLARACEYCRVEDIHDFKVNICLTNFVEEQGTQRTFATPFRRLGEYSTAAFLEMIGTLLNSNEYISLNDESLRVYITFIRVPTLRGGGGRGRGRSGVRNRDSVRRRKEVAMHDWAKVKRNVVTPPPRLEALVESYNACLLFALFIGKQMADEWGRNRYVGNVRHLMPSQGELRRMMDEMYTKTGLRPGEIASDVELALFADAEPFVDEYQIVLYESNGETVRHRVTLNKNALRSINLLLMDEHYYALKIGNLRSTVDEMWCRDCEKAIPTARYDHHRCIPRCRGCRSEACAGARPEAIDHPPMMNEDRTCLSCGRTYRTNVCFDSHISDGTCANNYLCADCGQSIPVAQKEHHKYVCGTSFCKVCKRVMAIGHDCCFLFPNKLPDAVPADEVDVVYFDIETYVDGVTNYHEPLVLCYVRQSETDAGLPEPDAFISDADDDGCSCVEKFLLLEIERQKRHPKLRTIYWSHGGARFDMFMIVKAFLKLKLYPKVMRRGQAIILVRMPQWRMEFKDTLSFIPQPLRSFTKTFSLNLAFKKYWAPFLLFDKESFLDGRYNNMMKMPDKAFFPIAKMSAAERTDFDRWYDECEEEIRTTGRPYNLARQTVEYCQMDVRVLQAGFEAYRKAMRQLAADPQTGEELLDPCFHATTGPSFNISLWLSLYYCPELTAAAAAATASAIDPVPTKAAQVLVANLPRHGAPNRSAYSQKSAAWLQYLERANGIEIQSALRGNEYRVGVFRVDGYVEKLDRYMMTHPLVRPRSEPVVFEFNGCFYHGHCCPTSGATNPEKENPLLRKTYAQLFSETKIKEKVLKSRYSVQVVSIWECEFDRLRDTVPGGIDLAIPRSLTAFAEDPTMLYLRPEMAFFGGRVECFRPIALTDRAFKNRVTAKQFDVTHRKRTGKVSSLIRRINNPLKGNPALFHGAADGTEGGRYDDVTPKQKTSLYYYDYVSLYPFSQIKARLWLGSPSILRFQYATDYIDAHGGIMNPDLQGLIYAVIHVPADNFLPVLPIRLKSGRISFATCAACAETMATTCAHSKVERSFAGTYTMDELRAAIKYNRVELLNVIEIWTFEYVTDALFRDFLGRYFARKFEASGRPKEMLDDEFDAYVEHLRVEYHIPTEKARYILNESLRFCAKINLNAIWGRLSLKTDRDQSEFCHSSTQILKYALDHKVVITSLTQINADTFHLTYKNAKDSPVQLSNLSINIGLQITSYARLRLFEALRRFRSRDLVYCDTDSVVFLSRGDQPTDGKAELGELLGHFPGQLEKEYKGWRIIAFYSLGAKTYIVFLESENDPNVVRTEIKNKGIYQSKTVSETFDVDAMVQMVNDHVFCADDDEDDEEDDSGEGSTAGRRSGGRKKVVHVDNFAHEFHRDIREFIIERRPVGKKQIRFTAASKRIPYPIDGIAQMRTGSVPFGFITPTQT